MEGTNTSFMDREGHDNLMMEERSIIYHDGWENIWKEIIVELLKRMWADIENEILTGGDSESLSMAQDVAWKRMRRTNDIAACN